MMKVSVALNMLPQAERFVATLGDERTLRPASVIQAGKPNQPHFKTTTA
jgi:hypothetical protein